MEPSEGKVLQIDPLYSSQICLEILQQSNLLLPICTKSLFSFLQSVYYTNLFFFNVFNLA